MISLRFGKIADAGDVAVGGEESAAGAPLFGCLVAFDGFVCRISRQEVLNSWSTDDGMPGCRVVSLRAADGEDPHARLGLPVGRDDSASRQTPAGPDPDQPDIAGEVVIDSSPFDRFDEVDHVLFGSLEGAVEQVDHDLALKLRRAPIACVPQL